MTALSGSTRQMTLDFTPGLTERHDTRRFSVEDLERFIQATGDVTPIYYLIERFIEDADVRQRRALGELVKLAPQLAALIKQAGVGV